MFVQPNMWSKWALFLMRPLRAKFGKNCQWTKKIKCAVVYGWGRQIFPKSHKEDKNSLNVSTACLFKKIDVQYASIRCIAGFQTPFFFRLIFLLIVHTKRRGEGCCCGLFYIACKAHQHHRRLLAVL